MSLMTYDQCRSAVSEIHGNLATIERMALGPWLAPRAVSLEARFSAAPRPARVDLVQVLAELREAHVDGAAEIGAMLDATRLNPLAAEADRQAAQRVFSAVVEGNRGSAISDVRRWQVALRVRDALPGLADDLATLPPAIGERIEAWVDLGFAIREAMPKDAPEPRPSLELRQETRTFVAQLRAAVRAEVDVNPELPRDLERQLLGFVDDSIRPAPSRSDNHAPVASPAADAPVELAPELPEAEPERIDEPSVAPAPAEADIESA